MLLQKVFKIETNAYKFNITLFKSNTKEKQKQKFLKTDTHKIRKLHC